MNALFEQVLAQNEAPPNPNDIEEQADKDHGITRGMRTIIRREVDRQHGVTGLQKMLSVWEVPHTAFDIPADEWQGHTDKGMVHMRPHGQQRERQEKTHMVTFPLAW